MSEHYPMLSIMQSTRNRKENRADNLFLRGQVVVGNMLSSLFILQVGKQIPCMATFADLSPRNRINNLKSQRSSTCQKVQTENL